MQNFGLGRTVVLDHQRGSVHSWGTGKFWNKDCIPEPGCGYSAVVAAAADAYSGSVENTGTWMPDPSCVGSCCLGMTGISEMERRPALHGSPDTALGVSSEGPPQGSPS